MQVFAPKSQKVMHQFSELAPKCILELKNSRLKDLACYWQSFMRELLAMGL